MKSQNTFYDQFLKKYVPLYFGFLAIYALTIYITILYNYTIKYDCDYKYTSEERFNYIVPFELKSESTFDYTVDVSFSDCGFRTQYKRLKFENISKMKNDLANKTCYKRAGLLSQFGESFYICGEDFYEEKIDKISAFNMTIVATFRMLTILMYVIFAIILIVCMTSKAFLPFFDGKKE